MPFLTQGKTNWKFLSVIIVLAFIVGGGILGYLWTTEIIEEPLVIEPVVEEPEILPEEEVEIADWQTYRDEEHGFEIKYPEEDDISFYEDAVSFSHSIEEMPFPCFGRFFVKILDNPSQVPVDVFVLEKDELFISSQEFLQDITINEITGVQVTEELRFPPGGGAKRNITYLPRKQYVYEVAYWPHYEDMGGEKAAMECVKELDKSFNQRLSSFKFIGKLVVEEPVIEEPEAKTPATEQKVGMVTNKTEYERDDIIKYTIINNSSSAIYPILSEGVRLIGLQKYNHDNKKWESPKDHELLNELLKGYSGYSPMFLVLNEDPIAPISISAKEENSFPLDKALNQFNDNVETYRLVFLYYESNKCYENSFWGNPECGEARSSSWLNRNRELIKRATSHEFTVKGTTLVEAETARPFCLERYKENDLPSEPYLKPYLESVLFLNFDGDEDKEIIGLCWDGAYAGKQGLLFVLDKQNNQYKSIWEKEGGIHQRYYTFKDLKIEDIDKDGIDEIIYKESGWYMGGGNNYLHLYSPKYNEWFWRKEWWTINIESGEKTSGTSFSSNLDSEEYEAFKGFLEQTGFRE